jgi:hypothetical protein
MFLKHFKTAPDVSLERQIYIFILTIFLWFLNSGLPLPKIGSAKIKSKINISNSLLN